MKTKKVTITTTEENHQRGKDLSVLILGQGNFSGLVAYLINKEFKNRKNLLKKDVK